jgi:hypothetical protein
MWKWLDRWPKWLERRPTLLAYWELTFYGLVASGLLVAVMCCSGGVSAGLAAFWDNIGVVLSIFGFMYGLFSILLIYQAIRR